MSIFIVIIFFEMVILLWTWLIWKLVVSTPIWIFPLQVVHGEIMVQSYSLSEEQQESAPLLSATKHKPVRASIHDPPLSLTPNRENLHEIYSLNGPAAFLDILSPPYGTDVREGHERDCHYYCEVDPEELGRNDNTKTYLKKISSPLDFWCDQAEYVGPPLKGVIDNNNLFSKKP